MGRMGVWAMSLVAVRQLPMRVNLRPRLARAPGGGVSPRPPDHPPTPLCQFLFLQQRVSAQQGAATFEIPRARRDTPYLRPRQTATQIMRPFSLGPHLMFTRMGGCPRLPDRYQRHRRYASHADSRPLLRVGEFDAIAKNVRVGYVFFFDDRDEYLEGDRVVG